MRSKIVRWSKDGSFFKETIEESLHPSVTRLGKINKVKTRQYNWSIRFYLFFRFNIAHDLFVPEMFSLKACMFPSTFPSSFPFVDSDIHIILLLLAHFAEIMANIFTERIPFYCFSHTWFVKYCIVHLNKHTIVFSEKRYWIAACLREKIRLHIRRKHWSVCQYETIQFI